MAVNDGYIDPIRSTRTNLTIRCGALVDRVVFDASGKAVGVVLASTEASPVSSWSQEGGFHSRNPITGEYQRRHRPSELSAPVAQELITASHEVILCAGALHTPAILQRSGVGDPSVLARHDVTAVQCLPGVGRNLQDHPVINGRLPLREAQDLTSRHANALWRFSSTPEDDRYFNDLYFVSVEQGNDPRASSSVADDQAYGYIDVMLLKVESSGTVTIRSRDPRDAPVAEENMLAEEDDCRRLTVGVKALARCLQSSAVAEIAADIDECGQTTFMGRPDGELKTPEAVLAMAEDSSREAELHEWLRANASDGIHMAGTCRMGQLEDALAVVDEAGLVKGLMGLRVCDASIMPSLVRCNTHLPCLMIGEVLARRMVQDYEATLTGRHHGCKLDLLADCPRAIADTIGAWIHAEWPTENQAPFARCRCSERKVLI